MTNTRCKSMKIFELFSKPVERPIEGVIKADDLRNLQSEVEEYVVTDIVKKGLNVLTERYLDEKTSNGVWISGFFGSGKSHLLKILSLVLENRKMENGRTASQIIMEKIDDELLKGDLKKSAAIPSRSVLFNIDQKADSIGGDSTSPILAVFVKVMDELQGYFANQPHIAQFEHDLELRGELEGFKKTYERVSKRTWEKDLSVIETIENETFAKAYSEHFKKSEDEGLKLFDRHRGNYKVSIESFAKRVKAYIDKQPAGFRLNFFVDEVGQFIGQDSKMMLNLQTVVETLSTVCKGQAWVFVTSQGDLASVLGDLRERGQDFTKIEARFKSRLTLTSADVKEVIQKRLLEKKETEPEVLTDIYDKERENLQTIYRFGDGTAELKNWRGSDEFCAFYPFHPYQFYLFQYAMQSLSRHNFFTGRNTAVGARSMLAVFQEVTKEMRNETVGVLATFDKMFEGISASIRGDLQTSLRLAEKQIDNRIAIRVLKALFLLKHVKEFKGTPRNIAILLIDRPDIDISSHEKSVREALNILETQSYIQRNAEIYEYMTDTEKDIEVEIKTTDVDEQQLVKLIGDVIFTDILRDPKIRYEGNLQDYQYTKKIDDQQIGREFEVAVNIITTNHPNHGEWNTLAAQNTGKPELLVVLPSDTRLIDEVRLFMKTQKYINQNTGGSVDETRKSILSERGQQNNARRKNIEARCADLLSKAPLCLNASRLDSISEGDARNRFAKAAQELIKFSYPCLRMLTGKYDETTLSKVLNEKSDLFGANGTPLPMSEAEQEILTYVMRNQNNGERNNVEDIIRTFGKRSYGWYPMAVLTLVARLFRIGKVELRDTDLLDAKSALEALKNSRRYGAISVRMQEQFTPEQVAELKRFHFDFFSRPNEANDAKSVAQVTAEAIKGEADDIQEIFDQSENYPFLKQLEPALNKIISIKVKDYSYYLKNVSAFKKELLDAKDELIEPVKSFMHGSQKKTYDDVISFFKEEVANFAEVPQSDFAPLIALKESLAPYKGNLIPEAKKAVERIRGIISKKLEDERKKALDVIAGQKSKLENTADFSKLSPAQKEQVMVVYEDAYSAVNLNRFISAIRDRVETYRTKDFPSQLGHVSQLIQDASPKGKGGEPPSKQEFVSVSRLKSDCGLPYISCEEDIDKWLAGLRKSAVAELKKGNRISL